MGKLKLKLVKRFNSTQFIKFLKKNWDKKYNLIKNFVDDTENLM
jgi:hypothetical protein